MTFITTAERMGLEKGLAEGLEKGLAEGLEKGLAEGLEKGREEGPLAGIELGLKLRFAVEGLALMPEIRQIQGADLLQQVLASIEQAGTPDAVRQVWAKH